MLFWGVLILLLSLFFCYQSPIVTVESVRCESFTLDSQHSTMNISGPILNRRGASVNLSILADVDSTSGIRVEHNKSDNLEMTFFSPLFCELVFPGECFFEIIVSNVSTDVRIDPLVLITLMNQSGEASGSYQFTKVSDGEPWQWATPSLSSLVVISYLALITTIFWYCENKR